MRPTHSDDGEPWSQDLSVKSDDCSLAVRDYGGEGPPVLLLHGAGGSLLVWRRLAAGLTTRRRVVAMDLRGHGHSTGAPWSWEAAVADIEAVLAHLRIPEAALVGHSLGGILAAVYAAEHPETTAVVNIDGHVADSDALLRRLDPDAAPERLAWLERAQEAQAGRRFTPQQVQTLVRTATTGADCKTGAETEAGSAILRCLSRRPDGSYELRPDPNTTRALRDAIKRLDLFGLYQRLTSPLLVICAIAKPPAPPSMPWLAELQHAHQADLNDRFARFTAPRSVRVDRVESTHARILIEPTLPSRIDRFLPPAQDPH